MSDNDRDKWNERYRTGAYALRTHPSQLLLEWVDRIPTGRALDVACGAGRNALYLAARGFDVDAVDISVEALERARESAQRSGLRVNWMQQDLDGQPALQGEYQLILMIRFVHLPLLRTLATRLAPEGFLVCEQHLVSDAPVIGPTNPDYRVRPGELRTAAAGLRVLSLQEDLVTEPDGTTAALARLVAQAL